MKKTILTVTITAILTTIIGVTLLFGFLNFASSRKSESSEIRSIRSPQETCTANLDFSAEEACYEVSNISYENGMNLVDNYQRTEIETDSQMLIRTVNCSMETTSFETVLNTIKNEVTTQGGYFESSDVRGTGTNNNYRYANLIIRVPDNNLEGLTSILPELATVTYTSESCEDVTMTYVDMRAHVESLRIEQETLNSLLEQAEDLETIFAIQNELTTVSYEIESYESQLRVLSNRVSYATLNLTIEEVIVETPVVEIDEVRDQTFGERIKVSFNESLLNLKEAIMDDTISFISILPNLIFTLVIILFFGLIILIILKLIFKKINNKNIKKATKTDTKTNESENNK